MTTTADGSSPPTASRGADPSGRGVSRRTMWLMIGAVYAVLAAGTVVAGAASDEGVVAQADPVVVTTAPPSTVTTAVTTTAAPEPTTVVTTTTAVPTTTTVAPTPTTAAPVTTTTVPPPTTAASITVVHVVDGDTVDVSTGDRVRIIGIDTPERGECGYEAASDHLRSLVSGTGVVLVPGAQDDTDRYGRLLRYVDTTSGIDVGLAQIEAALAIARYDSRDGYGRHDREDRYVAADRRTIAGCSTIPGQSAPTPAATPTTAAPGTGGSVHYANCAEARAAGASPVLAGEPGYRAGLDRDGDGVACE